MTGPTSPDSAVRENIYKAIADDKALSGYAQTLKIVVNSGMVSLKGSVRSEAYSGYAAVSWAPDGGGMDGLDTASVTLTGQGPRVSITHPYLLP